MGILGLLTGCGVKGQSPEKIAETKLQKKYGKEFEITTLERKSAPGAFLEDWYRGTAREKSSDAAEFRIWLHKDKKEFHDSYGLPAMQPLFDAWFTDRAVKVWPGAKVMTEVDLRAPSDALPYDTAEAFLATEDASYTLSVIIPDTLKSENVEEEVGNFKECLDAEIHGLIYIYYAPEEKMTATDTRESLKEFSYTWIYNL